MDFDNVKIRYSLRSMT